MFDAALAARPDHEALVTRGAAGPTRSWTTPARGPAHALAGLGVRAGDRVAAVLPNEVDVIVAFHGAMRLGAIWVGVNQALAPPEKAFLLDDSGSSLLLCDVATAQSLVPHRGDSRNSPTVVLDDDWRHALDGADDRPDLVPVDPHAPAGLAYTSGTTGRPKGAIHSQYNLLVPGAVLVATRGYGPELRKGDCLPLTILNMMVLTTLLVAQAEGTAVIMDQIVRRGRGRLDRT